MTAFEHLLQKPGLFERIVRNLPDDLSDEVLRDRILDLIWQEPSVRVLDYNDIQVEVREQMVYLSGHVSKSLNKYLVEEGAKKVKGVREVRNDIIIDDDLKVMVAQALAKDPRTRACEINVGCQHGWINLTGEVPDIGVCSAVEEVAASVPFVRGVIGLPRVIPEESGKIRERLQPQIGAEVIGEDEIVGKVSKVIIDPRNRLVSHILVMKPETLQGTRVTREYIIPMDDVDFIRAGTIWLKQNKNVIRSYSAESDLFSSPPEEWQPPFPYKRNQVLWLGKKNGCLL